MSRDAPMHSAIWHARCELVFSIVNGNYCADVSHPPKHKLDLEPENSWPHVWQSARRMNNLPAASVSVVVTTYNGAAYIVKQLESICSQTLKPLEVIVSDDGSTDATVAVLRSQQQNFEFTILTREVPIGINANVAFALQQCRGEFIAIADQDDIWELEKIERLISAIDNNSAIFSNSCLIDENGNQLQSTLRDIYLKGHTPTIGNQPWRTLVKNAVSGHALLIRRSLLDIALPFSEKVLYDQQLAIAASLQGGIRYMEKPLVHHRLHCGNNVNTFSTKVRPHLSRKKQQRDKAQRFYTVLSSAEDIIPRLPEPNAAARQILQLATCIRQVSIAAQLRILTILWYRRNDLFCLYDRRRHWRLALRLGRALIRHRKKFAATPPDEGKPS